MNIEKLVKLISERDADLDSGSSELIEAVKVFSIDEKLMIFVFAEVNGIVHYVRSLSKDNVVPKKVYLDISVCEAFKVAVDYSIFLKDCMIKAGCDAVEYEALEVVSRLPRQIVETLVVASMALSQKSEAEVLVDLSNFVYTDYTVTKHCGQTYLECIKLRFKKKYAADIKEVKA